MTKPTDQELIDILLRMRSTIIVPDLYPELMRDVDNILTKLMGDK